MKIFWKTYLVLLCFVLLSVVLLTLVVSVRQARRTLDNLHSRQKLLAVAAASQVEAGYHEHTWPFELLAAISENEDFACWRIVDGDGQTLLAHCAAHEHVGEGGWVDVRMALGSDPVLVKDLRGSGEAWVVPMRMRTGFTPWTFWLGFHTGSVQANVHRIIHTNGLFGLGVAVVLVPIALTSTRRLLGPMERLTKAALELELGNIDVVLPVRSRDELGQLVGAFGAMVAGIKARDAEIQEKLQALQQARDELEVRVRQRTAELSRANQELTREIVVRQQVEEELRSSEERYRYLYEEGLTANVFVGCDGKILDANKLFPASLGYSKDNVIGKHVADFIAPGDRGQALAALASSLNDEPTPEMEIRIVGATSVRTFLFAAGQIPVRKAGNTIGVVLSAVDITERKDAEEVLRQSEERYRRLLGSVTDYICSVKVENGRAVSTSHGPGCLAVTGYTSREYEADPFLWYRMVHEADRQAVKEHADAIVSGKDVAPIEHRIIHKDGSVRWISNTPVTRKDDKGHVVSYDALVADITTRKRAEEALRSSQEFLNKIINCIRDPIFVMDEADRFVLVNDAMCAIAAQTREQVLGKTTRQLVPYEEAERYVERNRKVLSTGQDDVTEEPLIDPHGRQLTIVTKKSLYVDPAGKRYVVGNFRDITERKRLEDDLKQSRDLLEQRVAERTKELLEANRQIRQAQADLVQAEKMGMLGQLVAGVAHEINTPTGAIMNVAADGMGHLRELAAASMKVLELPGEVRQWLAAAIPHVLSQETVVSEIADRDTRREIERELRRQGIADSRRTAEVMAACGLKASDPLAVRSVAEVPVLVFLEHLTALKASSEICHASVQKIARIVRALRYYSRSGEGEMFDVNVNESIDNTLVIVQNRIKHVARVQRQYQESLPAVRCGPDISQVWTNILTNACDAIEGFRGRKAGLIRITTMADAGELVVEVFNEGPPIAEDLMPRVFDPFVTTKPIGKGTGLGLSICAGILRKYGGRITARNDAEGVTFRVSLPLARRNAVDTGRSVPDTAEPVAAQTAASGEGQ